MRLVTEGVRGIYMKEGREKEGEKWVCREWVEMGEGR